MAARQVPQADRTLFGPRREAATPAGRPLRTTQNRLPKIKAPISQPTSELSLWFTRRFALGSRRMRRIGIVALARKLLVQLWRYLETGTVPAGAVLKM